jgi:flagellar motor switch protein FliM
MTVEPYDFRKPGRIAGALAERLTTWLGGVGKLTADRWARQLAYRVELQPQRPESARPAAALARLPEAAVGYRIRLGPDGLQALLALPRPLALVLAAGMVGDPGSQLPADRELTVVEESLGEYLLQQLAEVLQETWPGANPLTVQVGQREANPRYARLFGPEAEVVVCPLAVRGPFGDQEAYWLLPQKGVLDQLDSAQTRPPEAPQEQANRQRIESLVRELPVDVAVSLGTASLPLSSLASLHAGDVLVLNQRVSEPLTARIAGEKKFRVWPGRVGSQQAVQVESLPPEG